MYMIHRNAKIWKRTKNWRGKENRAPLFYHIRSVPVGRLWSSMRIPPLNVSISCIQHASTKFKTFFSVCRLLFVGDTEKQKVGTLPHPSGRHLLSLLPLFHFYFNEDNAPSFASCPCIFCYVFSLWTFSLLSKNDDRKLLRRVIRSDFDLLFCLSLGLVLLTLDPFKLSYLGQQRRDGRYKETYSGSVWLAWDFPFSFSPHSISKSFFQPWKILETGERNFGNAPKGFSIDLESFVCVFDWSILKFGWTEDKTPTRLSKLNAAAVCVRVVFSQSHLGDPLIVWLLLVFFFFLFCFPFDAKKTMAAEERIEKLFLFPWARDHLIGLATEAGPIFRSTRQKLVPLISLALPSPTERNTTTEPLPL